MYRFVERGSQSENSLVTALIHSASHFRSKYYAHYHDFSPWTVDNRVLSYIFLRQPISVGHFGHRYTLSVLSVSTSR